MSISHIQFSLYIKSIFSDKLPVAFCCVMLMFYGRLHPLPDPVVNLILWLPLFSQVPCLQGSRNADGRTILSAVLCAERHGRQAPQRSKRESGLNPSTVQCHFCDKDGWNRSPSSARCTLELFQSHCWGNFSEMGQSLCGLFEGIDILNWTDGDHYSRRFGGGGGGGGGELIYN